MLDFRPDLPTDTPGLLITVADMIPTPRGYRVWHCPTAQTAHSLTLGGTEGPISSLFATKWLSTPGGIVIAGTDKDLYVYDYTNGFIKVSKAGGYSLAGSAFQYGEDAQSAFDHCAFGDVLIATHRSTFPQYRSALDRTIATLYANLGTTVAAPKASVCAVASNFVFLGDLAGTWGSGPTTGTRDMVAWCGIGDHQNWDVTPLSSQGSFQQFVDVPGVITALVPFQDGLVVFKANAMYLGRYVGSGVNSPIWEFTRVSDRIGCIGHRSVVDIGGSLVFIGPEDAYIFDGTRPRSITDGVWEQYIKGFTVYGGISPMWVGHDKINNCVMISKPGGALGASLVWSYRLNKWGYLKTGGNGGDVSSGTPYNGIDVFCRTNTNDFRAVTTTQTSGTISTDHYDLYTMFATRSGESGGVATACKCYNRFNTTGNFSTTALMQTGSIGHDVNVSKFTRVAPKWGANILGLPHGATLRMNTRSSLGDDWITGSTTITEDARRRFDLLSLGNTATNWASFILYFLGQGEEVIDLGIDKVPAGTK